MRIGRRLIALSLNVLLLHLAWTGSPGACAPAMTHGHDAAAMSAMRMPTGPAVGEPMNGDHGDCSGDMLGGDCASMAGCATASLIALSPVAALVPILQDPPRALNALHAPRALSAPLPPPPRA